MIIGPAGCCCGACGPAVAPATLTAAFTSNCSLLNGISATLPLILDTGTTRQWQTSGTIEGCPCDKWTLTVTCSLVSGVPQWTVIFTISSTTGSEDCVIVLDALSPPSVTVTSSDPVNITFTDNQIVHFGNPASSPAYCCNNVTLSIVITS